MIKKIGLTILGILLILLTELSLHLPAKFVLYTRSLEESKYTNKVAKVIYCIGDSHTFGVGTSHKYSYPNQLQELLNLNNPETTFKVINLGIPGDSTKHQIERLSDFLSKNRVDIAMLLTGRNNQYEPKLWKEESFALSIVLKIKKLKMYKIMEYIIGHILRRKNIEKDIMKSDERKKYEDYMKHQLIGAKALCEKYGCKLLLLSYYNRSDEYIEKLAGRFGILYFNLCRDFSESISQENQKNFISPDKSHMNLYGYKLFAELLYKQMFLHRAALGLRINPLGKKIDKSNFYQNVREVKDAVTTQQNRIENNPKDPFELIQLGHIYMEISEGEKARICYLKALELSHYMDNNTIVSPIINWYLEHNMYEEAYRMCQEIILHNKDNNIAKSYLRYIEEKHFISEKPKL